MQARTKAILAVAVIVSFVAGFGISWFVKPTPPPVKKPAEGMYFRLVTHGGSDPFWAVVRKGMEDACELLGCKADIDLCGSDLSLQLKRFEEAVAMKPDGIALVINDDKAWDKPVAEALAKGVPVIGMNNDDTEDGWGNPRLFYIGQNEVRAGYILARHIFEEAKKRGWDLSKCFVAMYAEVPGANYARLRSQGIIKAMKEFGVGSALSKPYEIVDCGGLEMTVVERRETSHLVAHPEIKFAFGLGGICTDRLATALKNAGKKPGEILAGGFDCCPGTLEGIKEGYLVCTIDQQQYLQGFFAVLCLWLYKKYGFRPNIETGGYIVDKNTIGLIEKLSPLHIR